MQQNVEILHWASCWSTGMEILLHMTHCGGYIIWIALRCLTMRRPAHHAMKRASAYVHRRLPQTKPGNYSFDA